MNYVEFITNKFLGKTVHCVGSGPSLSEFDYSILRGKTVIPLNHAYKKVPQFVFKVGIDKNFYRREDTNAENVGLTLCPALALQHPKAINFKMAAVFMETPGPVYAFGSSGLAGLTIALQGGARRVILWGFDYCYLNGRHHATQGEFTHCQGEGREHVFASAKSKFSVFPRERVFLATPSALPYFEKISINDALND